MAKELELKDQVDCLYEVVGNLMKTVVSHSDRMDILSDRIDVANKRIDNLKKATS